MEVVTLLVTFGVFFKAFIAFTHVRTIGVFSNLLISSYSFLFTSLKDFF